MHHLLMRSIGRSFERNVEGHLLACAHHCEPGSAAEWLGGEPIVEGVGVVDHLSVNADDEIACLEPGPPGRAGWTDARNQRAGRTLETEAVGDLRSDRLQSRAEPWPLDRRCRHSSPR